MKFGQGQTLRKKSDHSQRVKVTEVDDDGFCDVEPIQNSKLTHLFDLDDEWEDAYPKDENFITLYNLLNEDE